MRYLADWVVASPSTVYRNGYLDVEGDRIVGVGESDGSPGVDLGGVVMAGMVNTHGHSAMTLLRSAGDGLALGPWLREVIWPREGKMTPEDVYWGMLLGAGELLRNGVTMTSEHYYPAAPVADAALESGIRCVLTPGIFDVGWEKMLDDACGLHAARNGEGGRLTVGLGPHSAYVLPEAALRGVATAAQELGGALIQTHLAETRAEEEEARDLHGCRSIEILEATGMLEANLLAAHAIWLTDEDLDRLVKYDVAVGHCPGSNGKLGSGVARLPELLSRGIRVGLGTDGPASNDNLDRFDELRLAPTIARSVAADPTVVSTTDALRLATVGGADALGIEAGYLAEGRLADFIRLETDDLALSPGLEGEEIVAHLVWSASSRQVTDVFVGGERVVEAGKCLTIDLGRARREVTDRASRLRS